MSSVLIHELVTNFFVQFLNRVKSYPIYHSFLPLMFSLFQWFRLRNLASGQTNLCVIFSFPGPIIGIYKSSAWWAYLGKLSSPHQAWCKVSAFQSLTGVAVKNEPPTSPPASCALTHICIPSSNIFIWSPFYLGLSLRSSQMPLSKPYWGSEGKL